MRNFWALPAIWRLAIASQPAFSVQNDILAFPQYEIVFSDSFISPTEAESLLQLARNPPVDGDAEGDQDANPLHRDISKHTDTTANPSSEQEPTIHDSTYERIHLSSTPYLCTIPTVAPPTADNTTAEATPEEKQQELMRASAHGWELLEGMQGNCLYYPGGWWVYSFCYNQGIKQFHALPPGRPGVPIYPPVEDKEMKSYILGRFDPDDSAGDNKKAGTVDGGGEDGVNEKDGEQDKDADSDAEHKDLSLPRSKKTAPQQQPINQKRQLQTHNSQSYLVRHLTDGTICDLTGRPRRITVQFHCNANGPDEISMIKETASCVYLMVIHTPRLCNDVAFLPPQIDRPNSVLCREIVGPSGEAAWKARKTGEAEDLLRYGAGKANSIEAALRARVLHQQRQQQQGGTAQQGEQSPPLVIGGVELGAQKLVGGEPSRSIKASNIVAKVSSPGGGGSGGGKVIATLAKSDGRSVTTMTDREIKERGLDKTVTREETEKFVKKMEEMGGDKGVPWQIKVIRNADGLAIEARLGAEDGTDAEDEGGQAAEPKKNKVPQGNGEEAAKGSKEQKKQNKGKRKEGDSAGSHEEL